MRMSTRWPLSPCIAGFLPSGPGASIRRKPGLADRDQPSRRGHADRAAEQRERDAGDDIHARRSILAVLEQAKRLVAERRERREAAAESGREKEAHLGTE